jgi:hypothetical protein
MKELVIVWTVVISILSLLPVIVVSAQVTYMRHYKMPLIGREKDDLRKIFDANGYNNENNDDGLYMQVVDFFY